MTRTDLRVISRKPWLNRRPLSDEWPKLRWWHCLVPFLYEVYRLRCERIYWKAAVCGYAGEGRRPITQGELTRSTMTFGIASWRSSGD